MVFSNQYFLKPREKEIISHLITAACASLEISEQQLLQSPRREVAYLRQQLYYIIIKNTTAKDYMVADFFCKTRRTIGYGLEVIDAHKNIYSQTVASMNEVIDTANTFEKKHAWLLPRISSTR